MKAKKSISERNARRNKTVAELGVMLRNEGETKKYKRLKKVSDHEDIEIMKHYKELGKEAEKAHNSERRNNSYLF